MIHDVLHYGQANGTTGRELAKMFNCDIRQIAAQIRRERLAGYPICASVESRNPGYFLPANEEELKAYCRQLSGRAGEIFRIRRALLDSMELIAGGSEAGSHGI